MTPFRRLSCLVLAAASLSCASAAFAQRAFDEGTVQIDGKARRYVHLHDVGQPGEATPILLLDGSGCKEFGPRVPSFFESYPAPVDVYFMEKPGIDKGADGNGCSPEFVEVDYLEHRVHEALAFIEAEPTLKTRGAHSIAVVGFSEGGVVAPLVAMRSQKIGWLVTAGAGGLPQGQSFLAFADRGVAPYATLFSHNKFVEAYADILADPDDTQKYLFSHSYRYWSSHLFYDPLTSYAALDIPAVAAMGEKDENESIESGRALRDFFAAHPEKNFTYVEYPNATHNLTAPGKPNLPIFIAGLPKWFKGEKNTFGVQQ